MDERKKQILLAIIQDYIATAEPVGSRTISRKYGLGVSPATIRNEMADLEEMGFIEQPHTSSGRIPSELGYRYYVDYLMPKKDLSMQEEDYINNEINDKNLDLAQVINKTSHVLANMTNYAAMISSPQAGQCKFKHIQLVLMDVGKALLIMVMETGAVQHTTLEIPESISKEDLDLISKVLNEKLYGLTAESIKLSLIKDLYSDLYLHKKILNVAFEIINDNLTFNKEDQIYLGGILNILNQPEFKNIDKIKYFLNLFEDKAELKSLLSPFEIISDQVSVKIGTEIKQHQMNNCSLIVATYKVDDKPLGSIGVLGPTRMEYSKVITIVDYIAKSFSEVLCKNINN